MPKETLIIYYNARCSKCRTAKAELEEAGNTCNLIEYLHTPLNAEELTDLLKKLGKKPFDIIRTSEKIYKQKFAGKKLSDAKWVQALVKYPVLMQRPIVVKGNKAWVARSEEVIGEIK